MREGILLMGAGELKQYIALQSYVTTYNPVNEEIKVWSTYANCWAEIITLSGKNTESGDKDELEYTHAIKIRFSGDIKPEHRVVYNSETYEILYVIDKDKSKKYQLIRAIQIYPESEESNEVGAKGHASEITSYYDEDEGFTYLDIDEWILYARNSTAFTGSETTDDLFTSQSVNTGELTQSFSHSNLDDVLGNGSYHLDSTDLTNIETLTDGSDADALHEHDKYIVNDGSKGSQRIQEQLTVGDLNITDSITIGDSDLYQNPQDELILTSENGIYLLVNNKEAYFDEIGNLTLSNNLNANTVNANAVDSEDIYSGGTAYFDNVNANNGDSININDDISIETGKSINFGSTPAYSQTRKLKIFDDGTQLAARMSLIGTGDNGYPAIEFVTDGNTNKRTLIRHDGEGSNDYGLYFYTTNNSVVNTAAHISGAGDFVFDKNGDLILDTYSKIDCTDSYPASSFDPVVEFNTITAGTKPYASGILKDTSSEKVFLNLNTTSINSSLFSAGVDDGVTSGITNYRTLTITAGGTISMGNGINPRDTNLYRLEANHLKTDDSLTVGDELTVEGDAKIKSDTKKMFFGEGDDSAIWYDGSDLHIDAQQVGSGTVILENLPTSSVGLPSGGVWNDSGTLKIV